MTFVVVENTPGYLPEDDEPAVFEDEFEAYGHAEQAVRSLLEDAAEVGIRALASRLHPRLWRVRYPDSGGHDDRVIEVVEEGS